EDNADLRLGEQGRNLGLVGEDQWRRLCEKREAIEREQQRLRSTWVRPETLAAADAERLIGSALRREHNGLDLLRRPAVDYDRLMQVPGFGPPVSDPEVRFQVEVQAKYAGYIERQQTEVERNRSNESLRIPADLDYQRVSGLSAEVREKLTRVRPETLGQASRVSGVTPAAISMLLVHLKKRGGLPENTLIQSMSAAPTEADPASSSSGGAGSPPMPAQGSSL
ncbi:MAG: hypothetical protein KDK91_32665, partial [Gammaproteobacteria bacterium]|nr:hypothetical protein [Gammaproteobacteria bacterium]